MTTSTTSKPPTPQTTQEPATLIKVLAFVLALLLVLAIPLAVFGFDIWRVVFNPPLVKAFLTDEVVNSDLIPAALEWASELRAQQRVEGGEALSGVNEPDIILLLSYLKADDWRGIKKELLTDEFLTHLVSVTTDGTYAWIDSADRVPQITWDLTPFKSGIAGQPGENAITIAYSTLSLCTPEEIADYEARLAASPAGVEVLYNLCEFPDPWHDDQFQDYIRALIDVNQNIPDRFDLTTTLSQSADQGGAGPTALKNQLRLIRTLGLWGWVLPLGLLLLIVIIIVRSLPRLSRWVGIPLLIGGLLSGLVALAFTFAITGLLSSGVLSETPALLQQEVTRLIGRLAGEIFNPMLIQASVFCIVALGLMIWNGIKQRQAAKTMPTA
jgi:hypothetical protein